jgi:hypothetical protein
MRYRGRCYDHGFAIAVEYLVKGGYQSTIGIVNIGEDQDTLSFTLFSHLNGSWLVNYFWLAFLPVNVGVLFHEKTVVCGLSCNRNSEYILELVFF